MNKTLKKTLSIIIAILMLVTMIPFTPIAFAAEEMTVLTEFCIYEDDYSYPGGWSNDNEENYHLGIQDEGKTAWEEGDELLIIFNEYDTDTWEKINTQTALLRYENEQFNGNISFVYDENSYIETYGCIGKGGGTDEYINIYCEIIDNVLYIVFPGSRVHYSRLRIVGEANTSYDVTVDGFFTADNFEKPITQNYTLTTDNNGNAYLYGIFNEGAILSVNGVACTLDYRNGTLSEKSYAVCAVHNFSNGCCTECYVKCAHANCSNSVCNDCGYICLHSDTIVQVDAKAPTCTQVGNEAYEYCTACDYTTYVEIPALTHTDANCDYKCDYNCGYVYETLDFSDAKILTVNDEGVLCIDGVAVVCKNLGYTVTEQYIPDGKYKLASDISTRYNTLFHTDAGSDVKIDLNGYTWSSKKFILYVQGSLSIYDTSAENTGKIISTNENGGILTYNGAREINLYNGTLENIDISVHRDNCVVNLYGGKIKCDTNALICHMEYSSIINIYDTVLETSDGVAHIDAYLYDTDTAHTVINVAGYSGEGLTIDAWIDITGKFKLLEGIENAEEAEKYTVNYCSEFGNCFLEKTEYDETTGELYVYVVANAFTQQPSAENDYTVDFNNTNATFKWYEVEETVLTPDNVTAIDEVIFENEKWLHGGWYVELFTVDVQAGDIITVSTTSARSFDLSVFTEDYSINEYVKTTGKASVTIDSDAEVIVGIDVDVPNETTEFEIELIRTSELDETETDKTLQNPECGKTYVCKATVGENDYLSDVVTVGHNIVSVDAKAPTCTEIGWDAYEYCTACTYTTYVELPADPDAHNFEDGKCECGYVCTHETYSEGVCVDCGKVIYTYDEATDTYTVYTFAALKAALTAGGNIILGADITRENTKDITAVPENITAVLDLNGKTITSAPAVPGVNYEIICVNGNLTIKDSDTNGTITANSVISCIYVEGGNLTIEAGNFICDPDLSFAVDVYSGNAVINGGTFTNLNVLDEGKAVINGGEFQNYISTSGSLIINGGTFYGEEYTFGTFGGNWVFDIYGGEFHEDPSEYVANGYEAVANENGTWTVVCIHTDRLVQVDAKAPTCTEIGWDAYEYCTACTYTTYVEIPASHKIEKADAKSPTCTEIGWDAYEYCTACDFTTKVEIPVDPDAHDIIIDKAVAPKCGEPGLTQGEHCTRCDYKVEQEVVPALKHSFTKYEVTEEAKCGVEGKKVAVCDRGCGATDEKAIEALKHDIVIDEAVAPKCGETGLTQGEHCTKCDYKVEQEVVPALGHKDADGDYKCDNGCGHEFEKPAEPDTPDEPDTPNEPDTPDEPANDNCDHICHKSGFMGFLWKIVQLFSKLFKINPTCECGAAHY